MPNYCNYSMCVQGEKKNVEEFIKVIQADYDYNTNRFTYDRHLFRVFEANYDEIEEMANGEYEVIIDGYCAWSVYTCMFDVGEQSYYSDCKRRFKENFRGTTLPFESGRLNLDIEIFSEECGMCFQEHYIVRKGIVEISDSVDYHEYFLDEYETKEQAEKELGIKITDEEWENEPVISRGGYGEWEFEI